jgi:protein TonB
VKKQLHELVVTDVETFMFCISLENKPAMEANKILNADLLDLIFEDRNKDYGAYNLRKTYSKRILKALILTASIALIALLGSLLSKAFQSNRTGFRTTELTLQNIKEEPPKVDIPPPPLPKPIPPKVETARFTPPKIVKDDDVKDVIQENKQLEEKKIDVINQEGIKDDQIATPAQIDEGKQIIEVKKDDDDKPFEKVEIEAEFPGGPAAWKKFLEKNLRGDVASENGAPVGRYTIWVQFVVDREGNVNDVKALSNFGYGMEDEAIRVIKRGPKWKPAIQNGRNVKAYRKQPITFQIDEN